MSNPARRVRPLYVSATRQDVGKTTTVLGLIQAISELGQEVGYMKPVGQRYVPYEGDKADEDVILIRHAFKRSDTPSEMSPVVVARGFTEEYILNRDPRPLENRILSAFERIQSRHPVVLVEGTGHAGVGSCFDLSNARVAELLGASAIIITEGGVGKAIDEAALSIHLFRKHDVPVLGIILNKVWPEKLAKVRAAVSASMTHMGTQLLAAIPYCPSLTHPQVGQVTEEVNGHVLCGANNLTNRVEATIVAAMLPEHVCEYLEKDTLVITPGDRVDNILVAIIGCAQSVRHRDHSVSGLVLTGGFTPPSSILKLLQDSHIPTIMCEEDTYSVATRLKEMCFKIRPEDTDKIEQAKRLVRENLDAKSLLQSLTLET
jgi:dethiobiotin synthase